MVDRDILRAEALRINARYVLEVVETLSLCPWAQAARVDGRVRTEVVFGTGQDDAMLGQLAEQVAMLETDSDVAIGLLVMPEMTLERIELQHFTARLRARLSDGRHRTPFAIADFHPDARPLLDTPEQLVPFIRSSPDPTLQLVRQSAIDAVRLGAEPGTRFIDDAMLGGALSALPQARATLSERVARANLRTIEQVGVAHVRAVLDDITRDRDRSYARLGLAPTPWRERGVTP